MALFKISKGLAKNLMANVPYAKEGFAYFTTDDGKLYIDITGDGTSAQAEKGINRICLNSDYADRLKINSNATKAKDNQVARFNGNDGSLQGSDVTIDDEGALVATKIYATDNRVNETTGKTEIADVNTEKYDFGVVGDSYFQGNVDIKGNITLNGDAMTGNLKFQKTNSDGTISTTATIGATTGYITGTRLQTTSVGNKAGDFATIDSSGWIYKRTAAQVLSDIGAATSSHNHDSNYVKKTGDTMTGLLKTNGSIENQGEAKFIHPTYCPDIEDTAENIGCAFKASRGHFNQMNVNEIYLPATTTTNYEGNKISFKTYSGGNNGAYTNVSEVAQINTTGLKVGSSSIGTNGYIEGTWLKTTDAGNKAGDFATIDSSGWIYKRTPAQVLSDIGAASSSHNHDSNYVKKTGDTMTGQLAIDKAGYGFRVNNGSTGYIELSRDNGGAQLYGLWDCIKSIWAIQCDGSNVTLNGKVQIPGFSTTWVGGRDSAVTKIYSYSGYNAITSMKTTNGSWENGVYINDRMYFNYVPDSNYNAGINQAAQIWLGPDASLHASAVWGAVWNDYAECREADTIEPGKCVIEVGDDTLITSTERLMPGANITSDTFGFSIGETEQAKTPIAVSGRVLAYPYESREEFKKNIGRPVCSGPNGTVSIMTDEEYRDKGYCAIGTISAVPDYEEWGTGKVKVNGRVWIKVF